MVSAFLLLCLLHLTLDAQYFETVYNSATDIHFIEASSHELYGDEIIYGAPDEAGLQHPLYRVESFDDYLFKTVDVGSGKTLNSHRRDGSNLFSRYGKYWASNSAVNRGVNELSSATENGSFIHHASDIFNEGELLVISEIGDRYLTRSPSGGLNCYSIQGAQLWSTQNPLDNFDLSLAFLNANETLFIITYPGLRIEAFDMDSGELAWRKNGGYDAQPILHELTSNILVHDLSYGDYSIIGETGRTRFDLQQAKHLQGDVTIYHQRLVNGNIVIPNLFLEHNRLRLPPKLGPDKSDRAITPVRWSTEGRYSVRAYICWNLGEKADPADQYYRIDVAASDGNSMGFFYPKFYADLDLSNIDVQISNDGTRVLLVAKRDDWSQFICCEYEISLR